MYFYRAALIHMVSALSDANTTEVILCMLEDGKWRSERGRERSGEEIAMRKNSKALPEKKGANLQLEMRRSELLWGRENTQRQS